MAFFRLLSGNLMPWQKKDTKFIRLDGKCIRKKCDENPELGYELMRRFSRILQNRLIATRLQLVDIYGKSN